MPDLMKDRTILITGATAGIGRATAIACAKEGAKVVAAARGSDRGEELIHEIRSLGGEAVFVAADMNLDDDIRAMTEAALSHFGDLDFAFNNAGVFAPEPALHEHDDQVWANQINVCLTGVYRCMKHQVSAMLRGKDKRHRAIINNASTVGHRGSNSSGVAYTAAKHGVIGLTRQAAIEYADTDIRINAVCPGPTLTEATAPLLDMPEKAKNAFLSGLNPKKALVPANQIAQTVAFLCSDAAAMINGHALPLDGGQLAKL